MGSGDEGQVDLGYQQISTGCSSSGMSTNPQSDKVSAMGMSSIPLLKSSSAGAGAGGDPFYASGTNNWDPLLAMSRGHSDNFGGGAAAAGSSVVSHCGYSNPSYSPINDHHQGTNHLVQYPSSNSTLADLPKIHCFGSGNFSEMVASYGLPALAATANNTSSCFQNYLPNNDQVGTQRIGMGGGARSQDDCQISEERGALEASPNGKRRRRISIESASPLNPNKITDGGQQKDGSEGSFDQTSEQDDKKRNRSKHLQNKQTGKQANDNSLTEDGTKETYIHMRARRGQATNSHSLAERVRREKISERMKLLQELVPGCNKITGKAVMLDEIINYVQSLQQQVEFLSMKLATVNPELNIDLDRMLSKDILNTQSNNHVLLGINTGISNHQPYTHTMLQGGMQGIQQSAAQYPMPHNAWNNEFQRLLQMGFSSSEKGAISHNCWDEDAPQFTPK